MKKPLLLLAGPAALAAVLVCLAPPTRGADKKPIPPSARSNARTRPSTSSSRPDANLENLADGWDWAEGPVWIKDGGFLLCSDIPKNSIVKWNEGEGKSVFLHPSGSGKDQPDLQGAGSNGLVMAPDGGSS